MFRRTHDLRELGALAVGLDATLNPLLQGTVALNPFAVFFRYPVDAGQPTLQEAQDGRALAREVLMAVRTRLPPEVQP